MPRHAGYRLAAAGNHCHELSLAVAEEIGPSEGGTQGHSCIDRPRLSGAQRVAVHGPFICVSA
jgi:hypothetical protein